MDYDQTMTFWVGAKVEVGERQPDVKVPLRACCARSARAVRAVHACVPLHKCGQWFDQCAIKHRNLFRNSVKAL